MTPIERDWLLELVAAGLLLEADRPRLQALLAQEAGARPALARSERLNLTLAQASIPFPHDSASLVRQVMQRVGRETIWNLFRPDVVADDASGEAPLETALQAVPVHESAVFQAVIREHLSSPQDRIEYLACGLAGEFLDQDESAAAAHRLASDPAARQAFLGHEKLERLLGRWAQESAAAVATTDLKSLHEALAAETAPAPAVIPFVRAAARSGAVEPGSVNPAARRSESVSSRRRFGWFIGALSAAAALGAIWLGMRFYVPSVGSPSLIVPGLPIAQARTPQVPLPGQPASPQIDLAYAGPSLAPAVPDREAVLQVSVAPASDKLIQDRPGDDNLLPADDADARPRGTVSVAVDSFARPGAAEETMVLF